jgi:putative acetyltransferase
MIILIGGISCTGKTLMAQKLLEKYKIPYLSLDHLKMGLFRGDINCTFTPEDGDEEISEKLWPIIKGIIMTNIENNQNLILEGCYILPKAVKAFEEKYLAQIIAVFVGFSTNYIKENFKSSIIEYRSVIESRDYEEDRPITQFIYEHNELRRKCIENGVNYFQIDRDYEKEIKEVYEFIEDRVSEMKSR